jgi:hypothetical protein
MLLQADSTTVAAPWYAVGLLGLWQIVGPVVASWLYKRWTAVQAKLHGIGKALVFVVFSTLALEVPKWFGYVLSSGPDMWTAGIFYDLLTSIGATILYKFGTQPSSVPSDSGSQG